MEYINEHPTKSSGIYRCPDNIRNFRVRVKIKENTNTNMKAKWVEKEFLWQEKHFSFSQKLFYKEKPNCFTELDLHYHNLVAEVDATTDDILFTYIDNEDSCHELEATETCNSLLNAMETVELRQSSADEVEDEYNFNKSLQKLLNSPFIRKNVAQMCIMLDLGQHENGIIRTKNERVLCTITYDIRTKVLRVSPDFTTTQPYRLDVEIEDGRSFYYFIEHASKLMPESMEANEKTLIKKINDYKSITAARILADPFRVPSKNKLLVFVFLEILSGKKFEYPHVYVQYFVDLPDRWFCAESDVLSGRTQICKAINNDGLLHFGHCVEIPLEYNFMSVHGTDCIKCPYIYFEILSKDSWDRYRTEGLTYKALPICTSGSFTYNLNCFRFTSKGPISEMRRYFLGDCQNYNDVTWIGLPTDYEKKILNKYGTETIATGELKVRLNVIHQSQAFIENLRGNGKHRPTPRIVFEKLESSTLIKSVEQVIKEFKNAKKHLLEIRESVLSSTGS
ncbi:Meckel syndrome, type 1 isoform X1 [Rhynchophorus ferrugineus]|uniref:Meckel syndrome, type 1 isoform X1 n=2 Tax=Rhynchophorus ferrugineus TaxID=354439 RepID=UPI003FCEC57A